MSISTWRMDRLRRDAVRLAHKLDELERQLQTLERLPTPAFGQFAAALQATRSAAFELHKAVTRIDAAEAALATRTPPIESRPQGSPPPPPKRYPPPPSLSHETH
jgi:hypothetical protein